MSTLLSRLWLLAYWFKIPRLQNEAITILHSMMTVPLDPAAPPDEIRGTFSDICCLANFVDEETSKSSKLFDLCAAAVAGLGNMTEERLGLIPRSVFIRALSMMKERYHSDDR